MSTLPLSLLKSRILVEVLSKVVLLESNVVVIVLSPNALKIARVLLLFINFISAPKPSTDSGLLFLINWLNTKLLFCKLNTLTTP